MLPNVEQDHLRVQPVRLDRRRWWIDLGHKLGGGASGGVYMGEDDSTGAPVAIKVLMEEQAAATELRDLDNARRLLDRHFDHVITVLDVGTDAGKSYIVMPPAGRSLQKEIDQRYSESKPFPTGEVSDILRQIAHGLRELRNVTILCHRDLKPANVLYHEQKWKLADFGLAKAVNLDRATQTVRLLATPAYAPPELWELGTNPDEKSDIYSLGCIGYALLAGTPPFVGNEDELKTKHAKEVPAIAKLVGSESLHPLLGRMLAKARADRPSCDDVYDELGRLGGETH